MMQRRKIRGADIKPDPAPINRINAEKCIAYLRGIGVEIDDATADSWLDTQGVHRFLRSEKRWYKVVRVYSCWCGELRGTIVQIGRRYFPPQRKQPIEEHAPNCHGCGQGLLCMHVVYAEGRDGSVCYDARAKDERWQRPSELVDAESEAA